MRSIELARQLWRLRAGRLTAARFHKAMEQAIDRLVKTSFEIALPVAGWQRLSRRPRRRLRGCLTEAQRALDRWRLDEAVAAHRRAGRSLDTLRRLRAAVERRERERERLTRLVHDLDLEAVEELPTLRIPRRLVERADEHLAKGWPAVAEGILEVCRLELDRLLATTEEGGAASPLLLELDADAIAPPVLDRSGRELIRRLAGEGRHVLARRLAQDLEIRQRRRQHRNGERLEELRSELEATAHRAAALGDQLRRQLDGAAHAT